MKAYEIKDSSGIDGLKVAERREPAIGYGQARIRVRAASLNYRDLGTIKGAAARAIKFPLVPLSDGAGEIVKVGEGVTRVKPGDRVAAIFMQAWLAGRPTESVARSAARSTECSPNTSLDEDGLVRIPGYMSYEEAATLPCAAVTSWNALVTEGNPNRAIRCS